jgi:hypothetical protein
MADVLLLGLAKFPDHGLRFASEISNNGLDRDVGGRRLVDKARVQPAFLSTNGLADFWGSL